ncbi:C-terminal binding protein [Acidobacterium sp. S8]|uniref:C-terminal binding protein n=1 Tax=Acidobacterium sp. S8 TaxID=1641854 RepID=UPI00131BC844|nr:C-terminal binding protein [Acidobacterium sp. S8]
MRAVISDHLFPSIDLQKGVLESAGFELEEVQPGCRNEDEVIDRCADADVLLVQWAPITRHVLGSLPKLRGVVRYGIGVNNIDLDAAKDLRIGVANIPTYCIEEVSNHAVTMILSLARRIPHDHYRIAHGEWGVAPLLPIPAFTDLTLGLVGFGAIARRVADKAKVFGFNMAAADPYVKPEVFEERGVQSLELKELLANANIISLHCPLVKETTHLIDEAAISAMKRGVIIVNTSRGQIICEPHLIGALQSGRVLGAGLDVFEEEPLPASSVLRGLPNVILTSHAASVSTRSVESLQIKAAESARDFLLGVRPEGALVWPYQ